MNKYTAIGVWLLCLWRINYRIAVSALAIANWHWICQRRRTLLETSENRELSIAVFLAAYQEAGTIEKCLWGLNNVDRRSVGKFVIYVIGTAREEGDLHALGHTFASVDTVINAPEFGVDLQYVHYPWNVGGKAHQLNYALELHRAELDAFDYVLVVDADVVVSPDLLTIAGKEVALRAAEHCEEPVVLQPLVLTTVPESGNGGYKTGILAGDAIILSEWRLGFEFTRMRTARWAAEAGGLAKWLIEPAVYCVGACMLVDMRYVLQNGFPTPIEDTALGYRLTFLRLPIVPIPTLAFNPNETGVGDIIRQSVSWFLSLLSIYRELVTYLTGAGSSSAGNRVRAIWLFTRNLGWQLGWLPGPYISLLLIALHLKRGRPRDWTPVRAFAVLLVLDYSSCERVISWIRARPCETSLAGFEFPSVGKVIVGCNLRWIVRSLLPSIYFIGQRLRSRYRSIAAPGTPRWPVLFRDPTAVESEAPRGPKRQRPTRGIAGIRTMVTAE
jgi:hypothetical protein